MQFVEAVGGCFELIFFFFFFLSKCTFFLDLRIILHKSLLSMRGRYESCQRIEARWLVWEENTSTGTKRIVLVPAIEFIRAGKEER